MTRTQRSAALIAIVPLAMLGLGFASVPLYRVFCAATGFNGTTQRGTEKDVPFKPVGDIISVRFDANIGDKLPWTFKPEAETQRVAVGARQMAFFDTTNNSDHKISGSAVFNVTPAQAGQYFVKIQCFCFTDQTLEPGETMRMPVVYYVDPKFASDPDTNTIREITLSYTFYPVDSGKADG